MVKTFVEKRLLDAQDIRREYGLGRTTAYGLLATLPCVKVGKRRLLLRADLERFLAEAAQNGEDIREMLKDKNAAR